MAQDLILSVAHQLTYPSIGPFLQSLRKTGSTARIHLFVTGMAPADCQRLESDGVTLEHFPYFAIRRNPPLTLLWPLWREVFRRLRSFDARSALAARVMHLFGIRWVLYHRFLQAHPGEFHRILVSDLRDVFFQRDPFSMEFAPGLHCYEEAAGRTIGQCPYNRAEVALPFGEVVLSELADRPVICAGTTFGDQPSMLEYIKTMIELLCSARKFKMDQGTHNYLVYKRPLPNLYVHENGAHAVRTVGLESFNSLPRNDAGEVLGANGQVVPVLHQYDRHAELKEQLLATLSNP